MNIDKLLKEIEEHEQNRTFWQKTKDFFQYNVWEKIKTLWYNLQWFFHNIKVFWKTLWNYRDWGYEYILDVCCVLLEQLAKRIETGHEETISATKKSKKIRELIELLKWGLEDHIMETYNENVKKGVPKEENQRQVTEMRDNYYDMIFKILKGQSTKELDEQIALEIEKIKIDNPEYKDDTPFHYNIWVKAFDGSGIEGWWE